MPKYYYKWRRVFLNPDFLALGLSFFLIWFLYLLNHLESPLLKVRWDIGRYQSIAEQGKLS